MSIRITNATGSVSSTSSGQITNLGLTAGVSANALTVTLTQADGSSAPTSGAGAVTIGFRNSSANTTGLYNIRSATSTRVALTAAAGDTLGLVSTSAVQYIWVYAYDDAGTLRIALSGSRNFDEGLRYSVSALGGSATSATVLYAGVTSINAPIRLIGRISIVVAAAGVYDATPSDISLNQYDFVSASISEVWVSNGNGNGSSNTRVRRWSTIINNVGSDITYADSATAGGSFVINIAGRYAISLMDGNNGSTATFGATRNTSAPSTDVSSLTAAQGGLGRTVSVSGQPAVWACTLNLAAGDIIRVQNNNDCNYTTFGDSNMRIVRLS